MPHQNRSHTFKQLTRLLGFAFGTLVTAHAQTGVPRAVATLREVVVSGSRSDQLDDDLPLSLDVINAREIERVRLVTFGVRLKTCQMCPSNEPPPVLA